MKQVAYARYFQRRFVWILITLSAFVLLAGSLRGTITALPPIIEEIQRDLGLSSAEAGLVTSIPVFCFGFFTPFTALILRKIRLNRAVCLGLLIVILGAVLRSLGMAWSLFVGTCMIGIGTTCSNLVVTMLIGRDFRHRAGIMTAVYSTMIDLMIAASTAFTFPLVAYIGWRGAAGVWGVGPALIALVACLAIYPLNRPGIRPFFAQRAGWTIHADDSVVTDGPAKASEIYRWPMAWLMAFAFAVNTFCYFGVAAWLPKILADMLEMGPNDAGFAASIYHIVGVAAPLSMMAVQKMIRAQTSTILTLVSLSWLLMPIGMLLLPGGWALWSACGGLGQGAFFSITFTLVIERTTNMAQTRTLSALVQSIGYGFGALGPWVLGRMYDMTANWLWPFILLTVLTGSLVVISQIVARSTSTPKPQ